MNLRSIALGVGLLGALALPGCGGDDTPTPSGVDSGAMSTGAGGAGNDASTVSDTSTGKSGGSVSDSGGDGAICKKTEAMSVSGQDIGACRAGLAEAGSDSGDDAGASCFACLCSTCPHEAMTCIGNPNCKTISDCCRASCKCPGATPEAGSDGQASDAPSSSDATDATSPIDADNGG